MTNMAVIRKCDVNLSVLSFDAESSHKYVNFNQYTYFDDKYGYYLFCIHIEEMLSFQQESVSFFIRFIDNLFQ